MSSYDEWKSWKKEEFSQLGKKDEIYFETILKPHLLIPSSTVLEIGFGNGSFLAFGKQKGYSIFGVEIIPELVERANELGFNAFLDLNEIPKDVKFDMIVMFDVLEHIEQEKIIPFLAQLHVLLNDNGILILRTPNGSSPFGLTNQHGDITHCTIVTPPKLDYWSQGTNFELIKVGGDPYIINEGRISKVPLRFLRRVFYLLFERLARWVFAPQSKGFLSSNLLAVLKKR